MAEAGLHPRRADICPMTGVTPFSWTVDGFTIARVHEIGSTPCGHKDLFGPLGHVSPTAFEAHCSHPLHESAMAA